MRIPVTQSSPSSVAIDTARQPPSGGRSCAARSHRFISSEETMRGWRLRQ